jgi:hypothetical protein
MTLQLLAVLVLGLMCGSEFNVAAFIHPTLNRHPWKSMPLRDRRSRYCLGMSCRFGW